MNESDHTHGQLDKNSIINNGYEYTTLKQEVREDNSTLKITDIVACCNPGQRNQDLTTSSSEKKQEALRRFYQSYDPTIGLHTAAVLGGILLVLILYLFYKTKCKKAIKKGFVLARDHFNGKQFEKLDQPATPEMPNITRLMAKTGTWIRIDSPGVLPTMEVDSLEATAQWVQNHPVEMQGLTDVTGIILKIDTDLIQSQGQEKTYRTSKSDYQLSKSQGTDSVDSLRKTMLAQNHIGTEACQMHLTVPSSACAWGNNLLVQGSSSYPNIRQLNYATEAWKLQLPHRPSESNQKQSVKKPVHICNRSNIQIHRTESDDLSGTCENEVHSDSSEGSDLCEEPLLQQVVVETLPVTEQYSWPSDGSPDIQDNSSTVITQSLANLGPSDSDTVSEEIKPMTTKMETCL